MATNAFAARIAIVDSLKCAPDHWEFLQREFENLRSEADAYWRDVVSPAQARVGTALNGPVLHAVNEAAARVLALHRAQVLRGAMAECETKERRHEALLDEVCRLQEALLLRRASTEDALWWKLDQLTCTARISAETRRVLDEDLCRFPDSYDIDGARS